MCVYVCVCMYVCMYVSSGTLIGSLNHIQRGWETVRIGWGVSFACDEGGGGIQGGVGGDHECAEGECICLMGCVQVLPIVC